ncbi:MAG: DUF4830 domain-containing protein [Clostridia bacterium]|nr:DUF4830 domain-containing protein [Clostridia bacterium]
MFVYSVRASAVRFVSVIVLSVIALAALVAFVPTYVPVSLFVSEDTVSYNHVNSPESRAAFLSQFGWEVDEENADCVEVTVPARFDAVYEDYNAIQRAQGLNLERYRGKKVMRYTYPVTNYEGYDGTVLATILVYKDKVVGGDICSAEVNGFLHGFAKE